MASPPDRDPEPSSAREPSGRLGEGYFILGMAVQVGLVGLVGLALIGVQGMGFISLGTAVALAGLAIGILAVGTILTLASLRHTLNVVYEHGNRIDRIAARVGQLADEIRIGDEEVGWAGGEAMDLTAEQQAQQAERARALEDPHERRPDPGPGSPPDPLEQEPVHPVIDVPGIDEAEAEALQSMGIEETSKLWSENAMYIAGRLEAEPEEVQRWQATALLMAVEGLDDQAARTLARAGITSIRELAHESPERLMDRIEEAEAGQTPPVGPQQADAWIQAARTYQTAAQEADRREA